MKYSATSVHLQPAVWVLVLALLSIPMDAQTPATERSGQSAINEAVVSSKREVRPLVQAHSHNDYEQVRPLSDALDRGFCSIEADLWLVEGQILVAHDREKVNAQRTLQALYLDPLRERIQHNNGHVFPDGPTCTLLIDVKSEAASTYTVLRQILRSYADILTEFTPTNSTPKALTVILSGNRAVELVAVEPLRYAALDGRLTELESNPSTNLFPLISDNWQKHFNWRGEGDFPQPEQQKLSAFARRAHEQGRRIRFWATPDSRAGWRELQQVGVDLIGTDNLAGLADVLSAPQR